MREVVLELGAERKLQELARHQMIQRLYTDILTDMQICEIEGWDKLEYLRQLQEVINGFFERRKSVHGNAGGMGEDQGSRNSTGGLHLDKQQQITLRR